MCPQKITVHQKTFNIAWGDMDALKHVNNVRYFEYFQEARVEWLLSLNLTLAETTGPVVIHVGCTFLKPIVYPATVQIRSCVHSLGSSSFVMDHDFYQNDLLMAQGSSKIVWVDYAQNKSIAVPEIIRCLFV
ncbi:MAG: acyl-CoA thioesterase [Legionellales bacterium]